MKIESAVVARETSPVEALAFSPDGRYLASGSSGGTVVVWDANSGKALARQSGHPSAHVGLSFSPDGHQLAAAAFGNDLQLWYVGEDGTLEANTEIDDRQWLFGVAYGPDGNQVAVGSVTGRVGIWDPHTGKRLAALEGHASAVQALCYLPSGDRLVTGDSEGNLKLWELPGGQCLHTWMACQRPQPVMNLACSSGGAVIASTSEYEGVRLWHGDTGKPLSRMGDYTNGASSVAFSPDGRLLAAAVPARQIALCRAQPLERLALLRDGAAAVAVTFHPRGQYLASGSSDGEIRLWDLGGL